MFMLKNEFLYKFKKLLNEMRLSGSADKVDKVHSGTYYRPGRYYEVTAERYNRAGWRDQKKSFPTYRYQVKVYDKEGNHRADEVWNRKESLKRLGFIPGTKRSKKLMLVKEKLAKFEGLKQSKIKQEPKILEGDLRAQRSVAVNDVAKRYIENCKRYDLDPSDRQNYHEFVEENFPKLKDSLGVETSVMSTVASNAKFNTRIN